jgi:ribonuclease D
MPVITDSEVVAEFCGRLRNAPYVTVDTEFMREKTYWPRLCLVQIGGPDEARAIDTLAEGIDLTPMYDLLNDPGVLKVFHAARQDIEIFFHQTGKIPAPMFDTQVAAMVCGFGDAASYETLVKKLAKAKVDKSARFTDWSHRPLSERQIEYALADVTHLRTVYEKLDRKLSKTGRRAWLDEEMGTLANPATYDLDPENAFRRIKSRTPRPRFLAILREIAAWRESEAQRRDVPRNRVLRDEALMEIAHHAPKTVDDLARTRGLGRNLAEGPGGQALLTAVEKGLAVPDKDCPRPVQKEALPRGIGPIAELLKVLLKMKCEEHDVAHRLVASSDDIDRIAAFGEKADVPAMHGWRLKVFGQDALALRKGDLAFVIDGQKLDLVELEAEAETEPQNGKDAA